ncbi:MAG: streptogrisin [Mycobacteriales bacterium]|jgi:streptogrisin C
MRRRLLVLTVMGLVVGGIVVAPLSVASAMPARAAAGAAPGPAGGQVGSVAAGGTPQVVAALRRDLGLVGGRLSARRAREVAAPAVERVLRRELGGRFGGLWMAPDGVVTVGVTDGIAEGRVVGAGARPQRVRRSLAQLDAVKAVLDRRAGAAPAGVTGWYVDLRTNSVVVQVLPGKRAAGLRFAGGAGPAVRVAVSGQRPRPSYDVRGGDGYTVGGATCSVGFAVYGGFLTAGHCQVLNPGQVYGGNGVALGTWGGSSFPANDYAWVQTTDSWTLRPEATGLGEVRGSQEAVVGSAVCRSGATTGVRCGTITTKDQTIVYDGGFTVYGLTATSACAAPGDSGGPFMADDQAQGLTSGISGTCATGGISYFQPVNPVLAAYKLNLVRPAAHGAVSADFDGDGRTDPTTWRPSDGNWYINNGTTVLWGVASDVPVPADYDGDGLTDIAAWRPSEGKWYVRQGTTVQLGAAGDVPVPADYDGDKKTDFAVWRPSNGTWYVNKGRTLQWGIAGDIPVPADYDGDGVADTAVWRPSEGNWYIKKNLTVQWGLPGDIPVPADYNRDGVTDIAVWRPSDHTLYVYQGITAAWGQRGDIPVPADYNKAGVVDFAVWRPSDGNWYIRNGTTFTWGQPGDIPLAG